MSIKNFNEWSSLNESVTPEQAEKVFDEAEKWSKTTGIKIEIDKKHLHDWMGGGYIWVRGIFGLWSLKLETTTKKSGQDSMYRQTYQRGTDKKWYITYPGVWSQYNSRGRTKPGNLKTFKTLIEEFLEVKKVFDKISFFFENGLGIKGIDTENYRSDEKHVVSLDGKDLKNLTASFGTVRYSREKGWDEIDPTKVEILLKALSYHLRNKEKSGKNFEEILEILEILKNEPLDKFLEETKDGDWKAIKKKYSGKILGNKFGL